MQTAIAYLMGGLMLAATLVSVIQEPAILIPFGILFGILCLINPPT